METEGEKNRMQSWAVWVFLKRVCQRKLFADLLVLEFQHTQNGSLSYQLRSKILKINFLDLCVELYVEFRRERHLGC